MVRELVILDLCDVCMDERDERVEGETTPPLYLANPHGKTLKPRVLTLCPEHWAVWEPLRALLEKYGQTLDDTGNPTGRAGFRPPEVRGTRTSEGDKNPRRKAQREIIGPFQCDWPGCHARPNKNLSAFAQHLYGHHRSNLTDYRAKVGEPRLLQPAGADADQRRDDQVDDPDHCTVPGCTYTAAGLHRPAAGLTAHRRAKHPELMPARVEAGQPQLDVG